MDDNDFKMRVVADIASIKADLKNLLASIPCEKVKGIDAKIRLNRGLIFLLFTSYVGVISYLLQKI